MSIQEVIVRRISRCLGVGFILLSWTIVAGCAPKSPEERVANLRSFYTARLNGFLLEEEPVLNEVPELEAVELVEEPDINGAAPVEMEGEIAEVEVPQVEVIQRVRLDLLVQHRSNEKLPGITVDVSMVDSSETEKGHWRVWVDTSEVTKATVTQFTHILEDVMYEEGDGFFAEIRHPIPADERGEYREFSQAP